MNYRFSSCWIRFIQNSETLYLMKLWVYLLTWWYHHHGRVAIIIGMTSWCHYTHLLDGVTSILESWYDTIISKLEWVQFYLFYNMHHLIKTTLSTSMITYLHIQHWIPLTISVERYLTLRKAAMLHYSLTEYIDDNCT